MRLSACESRLSKLEHPAAQPDPLPVPEPPAPQPEPLPQATGDLATVTTPDGTVWTLRDDSRVLANGQPFENWTWGSGPDFRAVAFRQDASGTYARTANDAWFAWAGLTWPLTHVDANGQPQPVPVVTAPQSGDSTPPPPQVESPLASPDGTVVDQPWQPITGFDGITLVMSDTKGTKDAGAHYIGYETGRVFNEQVPGLVETTAETPATEDGSVRPPRWIRFGDQWAFIAGERYGYGWKLAYKNGSIYQYNGKDLWYGPNGVVPDPFAPPPVLPAPAVGSRALMGGWRIALPQGWGNLAIDFTRQVAYLSTGYETPHDIVECHLPPMGLGPDMAAWPIVTPTRSIPPFWPSPTGKEYANGLCWWQDKLWVCPRTYYDDGRTLVTPITATDGETITVPVPRQVFSGFVKRGPGLEPLIGAGGDESGQGASCGPSLATLDGKRLIEYGRPDLPGAHLEQWNARAPRDPNYHGVYREDSWIAWEPRMVNGELQGRWAADRVHGGGLVLPEGICYWPRMGTGTLDYGIQQPTFTTDPLRRTYRYVFNPDYTFNRYELTGFGEVRGQELDADGCVYLSIANQWSADGGAKTCPVIAVCA